MSILICSRRYIGEIIFSGKFSFGVGKGGGRGVVDVLGGKRYGYWEAARSLFRPGEDSPSGSEFSLRRGIVLKGKKLV